MSVRERRLCILAFTFLLVFVVMIARLAVVQVVRNRSLSIQALLQRVEEFPLAIPRGTIYDHDLRPLTGTSHRRSLVVFPNLVRNPEGVVRKLAGLLDLREDEIKSRFSRKDHPFVLKAGISDGVAEQFSRLAIPGVMVVDENLRYASPGLAPHLIGYINASDGRGVAGLEAACDRYLTGMRPESIIAIVDANRNLISGLGYRFVPKGIMDAGKGHDLVLTIDYHIQKIVERVMARRVSKGAVVVMSPKTGAVLAMASRPSFDQNDLRPYLNKSDSPFMNRAISAYPPGSIFKIVVAAAALEEGLTYLGEVFNDPGYIQIGGTRFRCYEYDKGGHGKITFLEAMAYSCNPVFIEAGLRVGPVRLEQYAERFGFGQVTGIGLGEESPGILPNPRALALPDMGNISIGQKEVMVTPLQVAVAVSAVANGGVLRLPYVVKEILSLDGRVRKKFDSPGVKRVISPETASKLKVMFEAVTRQGTGRAAWVPGYGSAGKTGSAQTGRTDPAGEIITHAWFAGYAPLNDPGLVVVVFVEEGRSGGQGAGPVFREVVEKILAAGLALSIP